jgi:hypothetical protein
MAKTGVALVVTLAVCIAPGAMAHPRAYQAHTSHAHVTHPYGSAYPYSSGYQWSRSPGHAVSVPPYTPYRGWQCVTDEGQGRFLPCEMGGG